jgi:hypothetical protein
MEETVYRKCTHCFFKAKSKEELSLFVKDIKKSKFYYTKAICKKCNAKSSKDKKYGPLYGPSLIRRCIECHSLAQSIEDMKERFVKDKSLKAGYSNYCKQCNSIRAQKHAKMFPEMFKVRAEKNRLKTNYKITLDEYEKIKKDQNYSCAICKTHESKLKKILHIDHDHQCCPGPTTCGKCIRGLLCYSCNTGLGNFKDSPENMINAIMYLGECSSLVPSNLRN